MTPQSSRRGQTPVGFLADLDGVEAAAVIYFRLWCDGPQGQASVWRDFSLGLGPKQGQRALQALDQLCGLCGQHGRRQLLCHSVGCNCLGSDESCLANFVLTATEGDREDAMLIATLLVRADVAPLLTALATDFGIAIKRIRNHPHVAAARRMPVSRSGTTLLH